MKVLNLAETDTLMGTSQGVPSLHIKGLNMADERVRLVHKSTNYKQFLPNCPLMLSPSLPLHYSWHGGYQYVYTVNGEPSGLAVTQNVCCKNFANHNQSVKCGNNVCGTYTYKFELISNTVHTVYAFC